MRNHSQLLIIQQYIYATIENTKNFLEQKATIYKPNIYVANRKCRGKITLRNLSRTNGFIAGVLERRALPRRKELLTTSFLTVYLISKLQTHMP